MTIHKADILRILDRQAEHGRFPILESIEDYWYFGAIRLTTFRSPNEWLLVFDMFVYNITQQAFDHLIYAYGNHFEEGALEDTWEARQNVKESPEQPLASTDGAFTLDRFGFSLLVNGQVRHYAPTIADYKKAGVDVKSQMPTEAQILRFLVFQVGEEILLSPERLLVVSGRSQSELVPLLVLSEWRHPDVTGGVMPSSSPTFQMVAECIARQDPNLYVPNSPSNTHWSNWPMR